MSILKKQFKPTNTEEKIKKGVSSIVEIVILALIVAYSPVSLEIATAFTVVFAFIQIRKIVQYIIKNEKKEVKENASG